MSDTRIDRRFAALQAANRPALGRGGIGGGHIKLSTSSLKSSDSFSPFLPVANVIGNLELEILDVVK